ncbi:MAG: LacI family DNA-binding transcriptional regulator [Candidatus Hydrogenedentes bacterium]|nr:LacI family DNA-binding transcriptional regulator [Candidatus Hydrogenedentota bacterium]
MSDYSKPTIYDIARIAGVSANTVSRVLNDKKGVGGETRARIQEIIKKVDYHPHMGARALRGQQVGCVGVTLPAPVDEVPLSQDLFVWLFAELYRVFGQQGERICFDINPYATANGDYARSIWENLYTVCVLAGPLALNDDTVVRIHKSGIPYLALGRLDGFPECSCATVDYEEGAYISTRHLINRGHRRIAILRAMSGYQPGLERERGYLHALEEAGIEPDERLMQSVTFGGSNIASIVHRLLVSTNATALVDCSATEDASSLREGARRAGRVPGKDFEVVVWTYTSNAVVLTEACAHIWLPVRESAAEGLELLADWYQKKNEGPVNIVYKPTLYETPMGAEIAPPRRVFEILD